MKAIFRVDPDLDPSLQHGVFVPGREYEAWIRFSNGNIDPRSRWWPDARGMAIKLLGVAGPKLIDDETRTQDFILISHPVFFVDDLERYKATLEAFFKGGVIDQYVRSPLRLKGREIWLAYIVNLRWISNSLFQRYWSMTPYRLGVDPSRKMAVKYSVKPRVASKPTLLSRLIAYVAWDFSLKKEINHSLAGAEMWFDFYIQRYVDDRTPIEDSKVEWREVHRQARACGKNHHTVSRRRIVRSGLVLRELVVQSVAQLAGTQAAGTCQPGAKGYLRGDQQSPPQAQPGAASRADKWEPVMPQDQIGSLPNDDGRRPYGGVHIVGL